MSNTALIDDNSHIGLSRLTPWVVCFSAGLFFLYEFFQLNVFDVINSALREDFNLNAAALSWLSSAFLWGNILFLLPAGYILDHYSVRRVILVAFSVCVLGTIGFALSSNYPLAFFCHLLTGIANAFCFLACVVLVSRWFLPKRQGFVLGAITTMAFVGGMIAHTPMVFLEAKLGWRSALLLDGALGIVIFVWLFFVLKDRPNNTEAPLGQQESPSFKSVLSNLQTWLAGIYTSCLNLPIMVFCVLWGVNYLVSVHHLTPLIASNVVSLIFMGSIFGCPVLGFVSDKQGLRKPVMYLGAFMSLLVVFIMLFAAQLSVSLLSVLFFMLGFFSGAQVIGYPVIAESNSPENTGSATAAASVVIMGGGAFAQVLFGWLIHLHAISDVLSYTENDFRWAMLLFPVAMSIALAAVFFMEETHCKRKENLMNKEVI